MKAIRVRDNLTVIVKRDILKKNFKISHTSPDGEFIKLSAEELELVLRATLEENVGLKDLLKEIGKSILERELQKKNPVKGWTTLKLIDVKIAENQDAEKVGLTFRAQTKDGDKFILFVSHDDLESVIGE